MDWEWDDLSLNLALGCVILGRTYFSFGTQVQGRIEVFP